VKVEEGAEPQEESRKEHDEIVMEDVGSDRCLMGKV